MIKKVSKWLNNPKRDYREGLEIFKQYASQSIRVQYEHFLTVGADDEKIDQFDKRFPILINKISSILIKMKLDPKKYVEYPGTKTLAFTGSNIRKEIASKAAEVKSEKEETATLLAKIASLSEAGEEKQDEIEELNEQLEKQKETVEKLEAELSSKIEKSGLKVVTHEDLPAKLKELFDIAKEITPLMAAIHSDLSKEQISDEERKKLAEELCRLDDERRNIWDKIDTWAEGGEILLDAPKENLYSEDPLAKGMQIANRIERLKENISRTSKSIIGHEKSGKENLKIKAQDRLASYEKELAELEQIVNEGK